MNFSLIQVVVVDHHRYYENNYFPYRKELELLSNRYYSFDFYFKTKITNEKKKTDQRIVHYCGMVCGRRSVESQRDNERVGP